MKQLAAIVVLLIFASAKPGKPMNHTSTSDTTYSWLALGDSYTIGESVAASENFPHQTAALLNQQGDIFSEPQIIAKTGWTTDELNDAINKNVIEPPYSVVTLLIGVNNQYRGRTVSNYQPEFEALLKKAISFAGGKAKHVFVLSIPDWGVTPFAVNSDREKVAAEIDAYNVANKQIATRHGVHYIDITPATREASNDRTLVAPDGLHPSAKEYGKWAGMLAAAIHGELRKV